MLSELVNKGWVLVEPPYAADEQSVVARYDGEPIRAGFTIEEEERDGESYFRFRSGKYDLELKVDFDVGRAQARVEEAEGYE